MLPLKEKYNIEPSFYKRYFEQNAKIKFAIQSLKFMWFKEGKFLNPLKKEQILNEFTNEEIENFYLKNKFSIPQIEYAITTRCTLKCSQCNALIPKFNNNCHIIVSLDEFKSNLDKILSDVDMINHFVLLGGEPLLHPNFSEILSYALEQDKINFVRITTNATIIPNQKTLDVLKKYNKKVYFFISNYTSNENLKNIVKPEEIKNTLDKINVKYQFVDSIAWCSEEGFKNEADSDIETTKEKFRTCERVNCTQILNGKIEVCSKASSARELNIIQNDDYVEILSSKNLRDDLINFYKKPYQDACKRCIPIGKTTCEVASQL